MIGKKLTIFNSLDFTREFKIEIVDQCKINGKWVYREEDDCELYIIDSFRNSDLIFEGWDIPFYMVKNDSSQLRLNHNIYLVGNINTIKEFVTSKNINKNYDNVFLKYIFQLKITWPKPKFWFQKETELIEETQIFSY